MTNYKEEVSSYTNNAASFFSNNKVLWAVIGGVAAGIALASLLGSDKAKKAYNTLRDSAGDLTDKAKDVWDNNKGTLTDAAQTVVGKAKDTAGRARAKAEHFDL